MRKRSYYLTAGLTLLAASSFAQSTLLHLTFDDAADAADVQNAAVYTLGSADFYDNALVSPALNLAVTFKESRIDPNTGNATPPADEGTTGPDIGAIPVGVANSATPPVAGWSSAGRKALIVDTNVSGGSREVFGLRLQADNGILDSMTWEILWWTTDPSGGDNTVGLQSIFGNPDIGQNAKVFLRTIDTTPGTPDDAFIQFWTDKGDGMAQGVSINSTGAIQANTLYHDVISLEYNSGSPANSTLRGYRNGVQVGVDTTYDASDASAIAFALGPFFAPGPSDQRRVIALGYAIAYDAFDLDGIGDTRGLTGGIDEFALSVGVRDPSNFVIATYTAAVDTWNLYE